MTQSWLGGKTLESLGDKGQVTTFCCPEEYTLAGSWCFTPSLGRIWLLHFGQHPKNLLLLE